MRETDNYICHVGVGWDDNPPGIGSGRYPHGSGKNPNQHEDTLKSSVEKMRKKGMSDTDIAKAFFGEHATASTLRAELTIERVKQREINIARANDLLKKTNGNVSEVARIMFGDASKESLVRSYLKDAQNAKQERYRNTAEYLREIIDNSKSGIIDVSTHTELYLGDEEDRKLPDGERMGVTNDTKRVAIRMLEQEGYTYTTVKLPNGAHETDVKVLAKPGMTWKEIQQNKYNIDSVTGYSEDGGETFKPVNPPVPIDLKRVYVRYGDQGGTEKDGTIELRPGVDDISLGGTLYSQVRIAVKGKGDEKGYMKGMAFYSNEVPDGYDVVYNVNKKTGTKLFAESDKDSSVFKTLKNDPDNPFGALIKPITAGGQPTYTDKNGNEKQGVINKTNDEGDWDKWSKKLASQFLSKQNYPLIEERLNVSILDKKAELEGIKNLTNPVIKQKLLDDYAEQTDTNASTLKAKGYRGTAFQVILPIPTLKDDEVYAPNYKNGEKVALIRYPHAGVFEIPICTVNNKNKLGNEIITKNGKDAIGINQRVADKLSGADFDGDTALVIPMTSNNIKIKAEDTLPGLENWDHKTLYRLDDSKPTISGNQKQKEMGIVTNLITDMTVNAGAGRSEIERAVKYSMVIIDSEKHRLDYKRCREEMDIDGLVKKYQATDEKKGGASTILSRASAEAYVDKRKEITDLKKMTPEQQKAYKAGKKIYVPTGETKMDGKKITDPKKMTPEELEKYNTTGKPVWRDTGKTKVVQEKLTQMATVDDARDLVRDKNNKKEMAYANYANELKALANEARKISRSMTFEKASPTAKETYKDEIESLERKLRIAESNQPKERKAQALGNAMANERFKDDSVVWDYEHKQRERARQLEMARAIVGAHKDQIKITDKEWEAIQANAIAPTKLKRIIQNTDQEAFKKRATPKGDVKVTSSQKSLIKSMASSNQYTNAEIAERLGLSPSTISKILNE